ncbi:epoxide hydrolase [Rhizoctonia solani]|uniref:Epoxide hydrolase n=1 Tax=Rhizoctonia solani TaxID=456999 RepID=A0A8H8SZ52_9AGAM|nr:epoxide hydrolase [Rhizoctonia solani]QRW22287.1 epoxide hydrolase [Rhizoctonia solani]
MAAYTDIKPFSIAVPDAQLQELRTKLDLTRLPDELELPAGQEWEWGIPLAVLKPAIEHWRTKYDWRKVEAHINQTLPQFTTYIDSANHGPQEVHFVHKRSNNPNATPLVFVHGWPGNFLEVSKMIDELANPSDPKYPAFHVVAPSLPGFVFSQRAATPGMNARGTAYLFDKLMAKLGYKYYMAQGGDWGSLVCRAFAVYHQETCLAIHKNVNFDGVPTLLKNPIMTLRTILGFAGLPGGYSKKTIEGLKSASGFISGGSGYMRIQGTRPQTLAVAMTDSPAGLLAWIGEKLYVWTDSYPWTADEIITWTMLYWINGPAGGFRYYKENPFAGNPGSPEAMAEMNNLTSVWSPTPLGFSWFPKEIGSPPAEWSGINQKLVYTKEHTKGGHFAAWEVPELLLGDVRDFAEVVLPQEHRLRAP